MMPRKQEKETTEFIKGYQSKPCLWDITSPDYSNRPMKSKAYEELCDIWKESYPAATVDKVKKRIEIIRTSYRREKRRVDLSKLNGHSRVYTPGLWYFPLMDSFLGKNYISQSEEDKRTQKQEEWSRKRPNIETDKDDDEFTNFANNIGAQLKRMSEQQNILAQKLISDVIFEARTNNLLRETSLTNLKSDRLKTSVTPSTSFNEQDGMLETMETLVVDQYGNTIVPKVKIEKSEEWDE